MYVKPSEDSIDESGRDVNMLYSDEDMLYSDDEEYQYESNNDEEDSGEDVCEATHEGSSIKKFSRPGPPKIGRQVSYETYGEKEMMEILDNMTKSVIEQTGLCQSDAEILLQSCKYNVASLFTEYTHYMDSTIQQAGLVLKNSTTKTENLPLCPICYSDDIPSNKVVSLGCAHRYCAVCFKAHLRNIIGRGFSSICSATCPDQTCKIRIGRSMFERLLSTKELKTFERALYYNFTREVAGGEGIHCPAAGCSQFIVHSTRKKTIKCANGHSFCYSCKGESHAPLSCAQFKQWVALSEKAGGEDNAATLVSFAKNDIKPCPNPKCSAATQKISGCMHLVCTNCKCQWCWQCGEWGGIDGRPLPHHVHACNNPKNKDWALKAVDILQVSERFLWYCERKNNQSISKEIATKMYNEAKAKLNPDFVAKITHTWSDTEMASAIHLILSALDTVVDARNVLGWSYAYAFFIEKTSSRELFQHGQKIVEDLTEQLTKRAEQQSLVQEDLHALKQSTLAVQNQIKEFERGIAIN